MEKSELLNLAISYSKEAVEFDQANRPQLAFEKYKQCLKCLEDIRSQITSVSSKQTLEKYMLEYIERAEYLKQKLEQQKPSNTRSHNPFSSDSLNDDYSSIEQCVVSNRPDITMNDIAGLEYVKSELHDVFQLPLKYPNLFGSKLKPWKAVLLYGPPGTGKTRLAQACASSHSYTFMNVSSVDIFSKWQGESEKQVRLLFKFARLKAPSIIFIDEIDSLCSARSENDNESSTRVKTEFLSQMQGLVQNLDKTVVVMGATNVPWVLDSAIRRRFDRRIYVPLPEQKDREELLIMNLKNTNHNLTIEDFKLIASQTEGYSGSDLESLIRDVLYMSVKRLDQSSQNSSVTNGSEISNINLSDFEIALARSSPTVDMSDLPKYQEWTQKFGLKS